MSGYQSQIHRTRPSLSCARCRYRRVKCDRSKPSCGNCTKAGAKCETLRPASNSGSSPSESAGSKRPRFQPSFDNGGTGRLRYRGNEDRETSPDGGSDSSTTVCSGSDAVSQLEKIRSLEAQVHALTDALKALTTSVEQEKMRKKPKEPWQDYFTFDKSERAPEVPVKTGSRKVDHFIPALEDSPSNNVTEFVTNSYNCDSGRNFGSIPWEPKWINYADTSKRFPPETRNFIYHAGDLPTQLSSEETRQALERDVLALLPSREQCDKLVAYYFEVPHVSVPIVLESQFYKTYRNFWDVISFSISMEGGACHDSDFVQFLGLLFAIISVSLKIMLGELEPGLLAPEFSTASANAILANLQKGVQLSIPMVGFPQEPTICNLQAAFITFFFDDSSNTRKEISLLWSMLSLAHDLNLFQDASALGFNTFETEARRRLWWCLFTYDTLNAVNTGYPMFATDYSAYTTQLPSDLREEYFGMLNPRVQHSDDKYCPTIVRWVGHFESVGLLRKILDLLRAPGSRTLEDFGKLTTMVNNDRSHVGQIIGRVNRMLEVHSSLSLGQKVVNTGATLLFRISPEKNLTVLFQSILKDPKTALWSCIGTIVLKECHACLRKLIFMASSPHFAPMFPVYIQRYFPLEAILLCLVDLYERPGTPDAELSYALARTLFDLIHEVQITDIQAALKWAMLKKFLLGAMRKGEIHPEDPSWNVKIRSIVGEEMKQLKGLVPEEFIMSYEEISDAIGRAAEKAVLAGPVDREVSQFVDSPYMCPPQHPVGRVASPPTTQSFADFAPLSTNTTSTVPPLVPSGPSAQLPYADHSFQIDSSQGEGLAYQEDFQWDQWDNMFGNYLELDVPVENRDIEDFRLIHGVNIELGSYREL